MPSPMHALGDNFYYRYEGENIQGHLEESRLNQGPKDGREREERQNKAERQREEGAERTKGQENRERQTIGTKRWHGQYVRVI